MSSFRISKEHGVNPSLNLCYVCGEPKGVILFGHLIGDKEAPKEVCMDKEPCGKCKKYMQLGIVFISVRNDFDGKGEPHRTGKMCVVKEDAVKRMIKGPVLLASVLEKRVCFINDETWDMLGLPVKDTFLSGLEGETEGNK